MGKIVISQPIAAEEIKVTKNLNIIFSKSEEAFFEQIICLFENKGICQEIGASARRLVFDVYDHQKIGLSFNKKILR